jgi:hypothetical protein
MKKAAGFSVTVETPKENSFGMPKCNWLACFQPLAYQRRLSQPSKGSDSDDTDF